MNKYQFKVDTLTAPSHKKFYKIFSFIFMNLSNFFMVKSVHTCFWKIYFSYKKSLITLFLNIKKSTVIQENSTNLIFSHI